MAQFDAEAFESIKRYVEFNEQTAKLLAEFHPVAAPHFVPIVDDFYATIEGESEEGYVTTLMGRRRRIPELRARQRQTRQRGERLAVNTVIQGTAADIIKLAMIRAHRALRDAGLETRLVLQIHDELLFEAPKGEMDAAATLVEREMCAAYDLDPELAVDIGIGEDWLAAK